MGKLYIVPTPIGNLEDITLRAINLLKTADLILAEDTRHVLKLLNHFEIQAKCRSYHKDNEHKIAASIAAELRNSGKNYVLVSDAGTPGISDPAYLIVNACIIEEITVECLPGATAFVPALIESGLPSETFVFEGFLPHQKGRNKRIQNLKDEHRTIIFYESPYRVLKTLEQLADVFGGERKASVSREISKVFAQTKRGTLHELIEFFKTNVPKGEFVIIIQGKPKDEKK